MRSLRLVVVALVAAILIPSVAPAQNAAAIARLEKARAARPNDAAVARSLGIAYYKQGKFTEARTHLDQAVRMDPRDGSASLYLGLTAEQQKDLPAAKAAYQTYVRFGRTSRVRRQLEARLAAITRQEIEASAKAAVAQEQQLSTQMPQANAVAVMPFTFAGTDTTLAPLERGFAELITIDLARSSKITVVERARLQALLDELALQRSGATDTSTNVRAGKIIQAGRYVKGSISQPQGARIRVDAAVLNTQTGLSLPNSGATNENTLDQIFAIEKAIVLKLFDDLGVVLTTAERNAIEERPTRSLQAFLAYSKGLKLEDEGKYDEASRSFGEAARIDPSFGAASVKSAETSAAAVGVSLTATSVEANLAGTPEGNVAQQSQQGSAPSSSGNSSENSPRAQVDNINSSAAGGATAGAGAGSSSSQPTRDPLSSATGSESGRSSTRVIVIVRVPNNQ